MFLRENFVSNISLNQIHIICKYDYLFLLIHTSFECIYLNKILFLCFEIVLLKTDIYLNYMNICL